MVDLSSKLFKPIQIGPNRLANRTVMAPTATPVKQRFPI
jgi:2,4-dienoyl-CoA reductase-like NADH-dependent reductase (Old Yellow Enzyme family)